MYSQVRVIADYGYFKRGQVHNVIEIIPYLHSPRQVQYYVLQGGNTIPKENVVWA